MRVISGSSKGMTLFSVKAVSTRPTSDFVKENLFNIIRDDLREAIFLDLFAGTGAIGVEALSRGVKSAVFVDKSQECVTVIRRNLAKAGLAERAVVVKDDAVRAIRKLAVRGFKFHVIYMDPPYFEGLAAKVLAEITQSKILVDEGYVVVETDKRDVLPEIPGLHVLQVREYSGTRLVFMAENADY